MLATPIAALAQPQQPVLIGWLSTNVPDPSRRMVAFKDELAAQGWKEGVHYRIEARSANGRIERLQPLAEELATKRCSVIVTVLGVATAAAARAAPSTPIVQANGGSPVDRGLAKSLARPGGMVTGVSAIPHELAAKSLQLLLEAAPGVKRVGFLVDPHSYSDEDSLKKIRRAAEHYQVEAYFAKAANAEQLEAAISSLAKEAIQGLVPLPSTWFVSARARIVNMALSHRWPMIYGVSSFADEGALLAYGADRQALQRRAAYFVVRILKGAKPRDLPIEQPTKFELVINMKTASLLGLEIPPELLLRADRIIQ